MIHSIHSQSGLEFEKWVKLGAEGILDTIPEFAEIMAPVPEHHAQPEVLSLEGAVPSGTPSGNDVHSALAAPLLNPNQGAAGFPVVEEIDKRVFGY